MSSVIYKFPLRHARNQVVAGKVLKVAWQRGEIMAWVQVCEGQPDQILQVIPTGVEFDPTDLEFIDTTVSDDLVFHIFRELVG